MNGDGVQAVRGDTEAALRELCDLVDAALDESQAGLDGLAEVAAGLKAVYTAAVGAAELARVRTEDILATLAPAPEETAAVDASLLTERGAWTLERMRRRDSVEPSAVAPKPGPALSALPAAKLPYLEQARTVDDVIARFDQIIDWAIEFGTSLGGLGYFATVYRRATVAIREKIRAGDYFDDNARMARFDVIFAQRYFDALNAYFHPRDYQAPSHVWQWSFDGHEHDAPILLQHMLTAVNSHVNLDLGIAATLAAEGNLASLEDDFDRINMLLADEVSIFLDTAGQLSPRVTVLRRLVPCQDRALNLLLRVFRNLAWSFANQLDAHVKRRPDDIAVHDAWAGVLGSYYLHTTATIDRLVQWVAETESRDVAYNVRVLAGRTAGS
ncbi:DUF5995 family protein [Mycolicibacterium poriferae]|uniref:DUF5995 family protein n=1 Tax=Mycolicibacterium poriferae TaxID=39694 RepID=UPI0024BB1D86|nr:DUF5995 family protein [Mycolicibacterium poriferae]